MPTPRTPTYASCENGSYDFGPQEGPCRVRFAGNVIDEVVVNPNGESAYFSRGVEVWRGFVYPSASCDPEFRTSPFGECACPPGKNTAGGGCSVGPSSFQQDAAGTFGAIALLALAAGGIAWMYFSNKGYSS